MFAETEIRSGIYLGFRDISETLAVSHNVHRIQCDYMVHVDRLDLLGPNIGICTLGEHIPYETQAVRGVLHCGSVGPQGIVEP